MRPAWDLLVDAVQRDSAARILAAKEEGKVILEVINISKHRERFNWVGQPAQPHTQFSKRVSHSWDCPVSMNILYDF